VSDAREVNALFDLDALRAEYSRFLRGDRILMTGHSHQAWPDAVRDAMGACFDDAARWVDDKWEEAVMPKVGTVTAAVAERMGFASDDPVAIGKSTHELFYRVLSALPERSKLHIVTTTGEFHSMHRQLCRLEEEGVRVTWVPAQPRAALADALLDALEPGVSMLALSAVLFEDAFIVPKLGEILARAVEVGAVPLVDAYHAFNVAPLSWGPAASQVFALAGGYKYAQFGEGLCWLRFPRETTLRPVYTGWFADFAALANPRGAASERPQIGYGGGGARFAGSTFDPTALYRAEAALQVFERHGLTLDVLRATSTRQTSRIVRGLEKGHADVASSSDDQRRAGFVSVRARDASGAMARLRKRDVFVDARGEFLRLGPAPYLRDADIDRGVAAVLEELT